MVTQELIYYISSEFQRGIPKDVIEQELLNVGWSSQDVSESFTFLFGNSAVQEEAEVLTIEEPVETFPFDFTARPKPIHDSNPIVDEIKSSEPVVSQIEEGISKIPWFIYSGYGVPLAFLWGVGVQTHKIFAYFIAFFLGALIGLAISELYKRKFYFYKALFHVVVWSNLFTWLVPIIGFATALSGINICYSDELKGKRLAIFFSHFSLFLSALVLTQAFLVHYVTFPLLP